LVTWFSGVFDLAIFPSGALLVSATMHENARIARLT
jgi:hypothetical protein